MITNLLIHALLVVSNIVLCTFFSSSQEYEYYYRQCNKADSINYFGDKIDALETYKSAFNSVDFVHTIYLKKAYQLAIETQSFDEASHYGKNILLNTGNKSDIKSRNRLFKKSQQFKTLKDSTNKYIEQHHSRINHEFIQIIDSLLFVDQFIIRKNPIYKGNYKINRDSLPENLFDLDQSNWRLLYDCIQKYGFPSERNVGQEYYRKVWVLFHHNLRLIENQKYHEEIFEYVKRGEYLPNDMMPWYEQFQQQNYNQTFFTTWDGNLSEGNLKRINQNRHQFYMKGLHSYKLEKSGRVMLPIW